MTDYVGNMSLKDKVYNAKDVRKLVVLQATMTIGAAGAVGATTVDDAAITFTKNGGTGDYAITYPKCARCQVIVSFVSVANTVNNFNVKAKAPTSGTVNVLALSGATATNPASGDVMEITFLCEAE